MKLAKSEWSPIAAQTERDRIAIKSWFGILADGLTPYKAEVLTEIATDREKKVRAFMQNAEGKCFRLERTLGGRQSVLKRMAIPTPARKPTYQPEGV